MAAQAGGDGKDFDFDLFVIGGGTGGVRAARLSSMYGTWLTKLHVMAATPQVTASGQAWLQVPRLRSVSCQRTGCPAMIGEAWEAPASCVAVFPKRYRMFHVASSSPICCTLLSRGCRGPLHCCVLTESA